MCMCVYTLLVIWMQKQTYVIKKVVEVAYYYEAEASTLEGARRIAKREENEGNLNLGETGYQWEDVVSIEVAKDYNSGQPIGESKIVK